MMPARKLVRWGARWRVLVALAVVMLLVAASVLMGGFLTRAQVPQQIAADLLAYIDAAGL